MKGEPLQQVCSGVAHSTELALSNGPAVVLWGEKAQLPLGRCREWKGSQGPGTERLDLACWSASPVGALQFLRKLFLVLSCLLPFSLFFFFFNPGRNTQAPAVGQWEGTAHLCLNRSIQAFGSESGS